MRGMAISVVLGICTMTLMAACGSGGSASKSTSSSGAATSIATPAPPAKITFAYIGTEPYSLPIWIAQDAGIFQKNGLDVNLQIMAGAPATAALLAGQVQLAIGGGSDPISAAVGGADIEVIAVFGPTFPGEIYAPAGVKTLADLKGKKVAVTNPGATYDIGMREALTKSGLTPDKDVSFIYTGSVPNSEAALLNGAVSASPANVGSDSVKLEANGFHSIYDLSNVEIAGQPLVVQRGYASSHRDVVQRFIDSTVEAIAREEGQAIQPEDPREVSQARRPAGPQRRL